MQFLPVNLAIRDHILIFGCGNIGARKARFLADLGFNIVAVDSNLPTINHPNIKTHTMHLEDENYVIFLNNQPDLVVIALGDGPLSAEIAGHCRKMGIPVNVVDKANLSTIIFSSIINSKSLNFAISTQGHCPFFSKQLRKEITPMVEERAKHLEVLAILRKEAVNPAKDLPRIYEDNAFQQKLRTGNMDGALERGREILKGLQ